MWLCKTFKLYLAVFFTTFLLAECYPRVIPRTFQQISNQQLLKGQFQVAVPPKINDPVPLRRQKTISVGCHEESMDIRIHANLFASGLPVRAEELWLGADSMMNKVSGASCGAVQSGDHEFAVISYFRDCGTKLSITEDSLVYSNVLVYAPLPSPDGVLYQDGAVIPIQCQYQRRYNVDNSAVAPTWIPFASSISAADYLDFSLRLMSDDWQNERSSNIYFLGDVIHLQASMTLANHSPLLLFVDYCVATLTSKVDQSELQYPFIDNNGCFSDAKQTSSRSKFLQRTEGNKLNLLLDAFKFYRVSSNLIFITCYLKAIPAANYVNPQNRACSFIDNRWQSVDGNDQVCNNCEPSHTGAAYQEPFKTVETYQKPPKTVAADPGPIQQAIPLNTASATQKPGPATFVKVRPGQSLESLKSLIQSSENAYSSLSKRGTDTNKDWRKIASLGPLIVLPKQERSQSTGSLQLSPSDDSTASVTEKPELYSTESSLVTNKFVVTQVTESLIPLKESKFLNVAEFLSLEEGSGFE